MFIWSASKETHMRVIKLSKDEFKNMNSLNTYFDSTLNSREPIGRFNLTKGKIASKGKKALFRGEMLLFTWNATLVKIARSASSLISSDSVSGFTERGDIQEYPSYFLIDMESVRNPIRPYSLSDLNRLIFENSGVEVNTIGQAWNWINDSEELEDWFDSL